MFAAVDVHYGDTRVVAAAVVFAGWTDELAAGEVVNHHPPDAAPYTPGAFYERELPYLLALIAQL
ncbi:MAG: endonuclease V, partial [Myxococcales bacterium]|nr:endonuclease V [Myxococcales bacterium]